MSRPRLVLLPGLLNDHRLWESQTTTLSNIADISIGDVSVAVSMPALAQAVLATIPEERFALAGLSMGGYVALEIMRQAPERVIALALLDTQSRPDTPEATENRRAQVTRAQTDFQGVVDLLYPKLVHPARANDEGLKNLFNKMAVSLGAAAFARQQSAIMNRIDSRPFLPRIDCSTLVLCGRDDGVTPVALHEEMAAAIPGARLEIIEDCGHLSAIESPVAVTAALALWLKSI
jgi:pimeloyl-ACP methyl ester carboxylesterase